VQVHAADASAVDPAVTDDHRGLPRASRLAVLVHPALARIVSREAM
jgi:hypothetical protein